MYGGTPANAQAHWYQFGFNNVVGAERLGNKVVLHFVDGQPSDADLSANGQIADPGGPATINIASTSSGGGGGCVAVSESYRDGRIPVGMLLMVGLLMLLKGYQKFAGRC